MIEKSEDCPRCGEIKGFHYDAQICTACGYGNQNQPRGISSAPWLLYKDDMQRLSRAFNEAANLGLSQDYRINEWLKHQISAAPSRLLRSAQETEDA